MSDIGIPKLALVGKSTYSGFDLADPTRRVKIPATGSGSCNHRHAKPSRQP